METSILASVKKVLSVPADYDVFDEDILMYINMAFNTLTDLGVGPKTGFLVDSDAVTWDEFLPGDNRIGTIKTYVTLSARLLFDPPAQSWVITSIEKQLDQMAWRINVRQEATDYFHDADNVDIALPVDKRPVLVEEL